jgi:hypothetical protein
MVRILSSYMFFVVVHPSLPARSVMEAQGMDADTGTPAALGNLVKHELAKWAKIIQVANIRPE